MILNNEGALIHAIVEDGEFTRGNYEEMLKKELH